jgi:hypothetical protein
VEVEHAAGFQAGSKVKLLILGADIGETLFGVGAQFCFGRQQKQWNDALAKVPRGFVLAEAFIGGEPWLRHQTGDDAAGAGGLARCLRPFLADHDAGVVDENVGKALDTQPSLQRPGEGIVFAGMTDEKNRHSIYCPKSTEMTFATGPGLRPGPKR